MTRDASVPSLLLPRSSSPFDRALATIRQNIESGRFRAGERLPAEHELAARLEVSRGTLRTALKQLEDEGVLRAEPRRGRIVLRGGAPADGLMNSTVALLSWTRADQQPRVAGHGMVEAEFAVLDAVAESSLHSMVLHPARLVGSGLDQLINGRPLGVVATHAVADAAEGRAVIRRLFEAGINVVFNGNHEPLRDIDRVSSDHRSGAFELTRKLLESGRRRILRAWELPSDVYWLRQRDEGYEAAMREAGLEPLSAVQVPGLDRRLGIDSDPAFDVRVAVLAGTLVPYLTGGERIDAIMVHTDAAALAVAEACRRFGLNVHGDVAVVGYDDNWDTVSVNPAAVTPPLLTVDKQNARIGREMLRLLLERAQGGVSKEPRHVVVPGVVVEVDPDAGRLRRF